MSLPYFSFLLTLCKKHQDLKAIKASLTVHGLIGHHSLIKHFISHCCHLGFLDLALSAFKTVKKPSLSLQSLILRSLCDNGLFGNVLTVYEKCRRSGSLSGNYTYPFVIKACSVLGHIICGKTTHCLVIKDGFAEHLVVQTSLVDLYSKVGEMDNARKLIDEISQPDVVPWNALISGFCINSTDCDVFIVFRNMRIVDIKPNASTFASLFRMCSRSGFIDMGISLHGLAYKFGYSTEEYLVPALISIYGNCGDLLSARNIFDTSPSKNVTIWNAMISAYTRNQNPEKALVLFKRMLLDDARPDAVTFVSIIPSTEILGDIMYVESLHTHAIKFGFEKQISVITALLSVFAKLGNINFAECLFRSVKERNLLSWNAMISAYSSNSFWEHSLGAFHEMQIDGFKPNAVSVISILPVCSALKAVLPGKSIHAFSLKMWIGLSLNVANALLGFYCASGLLVYSFSIFERMVLKNVVSWNTMISGCINAGESDRTMLMFHQMWQTGTEVDVITLISMISYCNEFENLMLGLSLHSYAITSALAADLSVANALVSMYSNCRELESGRLIFDDINSKNVVSWNAILTGYRCHNLQKETLELFTQMIEKGHKPNYVTLLNVLPACCSLLQGKSVHAYIFRLGVSLETTLLTSLITMYGKLGNTASSFVLFRTGNKGCISLWNAIISACLLSKNSALAFSFFCDLLKNGVQTDDVTILNVIMICHQSLNLHISNSVLSYVVKLGFDEDIVISNAFIDLYGKCGSVSSARRLFEFMPRKDTITWSTIINVYGLHGDGESALALYSQMKLQKVKPDKVTYMGILSACSHAGLVEQGKMIFNHMIHGGTLPCMEHYACMVDLLARTGHLTEARELVKNLLHKPSANLLKSLLGGCLSHGNCELGEEIGRLVLEKNLEESGPYIVLYNIYAEAGRWQDANNLRLNMERKQFYKTPGLSLVDVCV